MRPLNKQSQKGITLVGYILFGGLVCLLAIQAARVFPAVREYYEVQRAIISAAEKATPSEIRKQFDAVAAVNNISAVTGQDLTIEKTGTGYVAWVSYNAWVNLFRNVNLVIEFTAHSKPLT